MSNPFESSHYFSGIIKSQLITVNVGEVKKLDIQGEGLNKARMTIRYLANKLGVKFKTKTDATGDLWVLRTK